MQGFLLFCCSLLFRIVRYNPLFLGILVSTVIRNGVNVQKKYPHAEANHSIVYRFDGKPWLISFGVYPDISLDEARELRQEARNMIARGINPSFERKARKSTESLSVEVQGNSFERVARQWHAIQEREWTPGHAKKIMDRCQLMRKLYLFSLKYFFSFGRVY